MMQTGPHPRAESEGDAGEEVVRFRPHLEANQPPAAGPSTTAQPPGNEESPVDPSCPAEWIHSKAGMAGARGSAWLEGTGRRAPEAVAEQSTRGNAGRPGKLTGERAGLCLLPAS